MKPEEASWVELFRKDGTPCVAQSKSKLGSSCFERRQEDSWYKNAHLIAKWLDSPPVWVVKQQLKGVPEGMVWWYYREEERV